MNQDKAFKLIDAGLMQGLLEAARNSPRMRANRVLNDSVADGAQRLVNVMLHGSYFTPHRHRQPPKSETLLVLKGRLAHYIFADDGQVIDCRVLGDGLPEQGIDIAAGQWHTVLVLSDHCICFEVKSGPYDPATDKEFAPWAPAEDDPGCPAYMQKLQRYADASA